MDILDHIPTGSDNAVRRSYLSDILSISDREIRRMIHDARRKIPILNLQDGEGYYIPDMNDEKDRRALFQFVRQEESRLKSIGWALKSARQTLRNCGIDGRTYEQQPKRKSGRTRTGKSA